MLTTPIDPSIKPVRIGAFPAQLPLGFGGSWFVPYSAPGAEDARLLGAIEAAYDAGIRHFDTAGGYGDGHSEEIYGRFLEGRRPEIFLASKSNPTETTAAAMTAEIDASLRRLKTDYIDLYYIHWPRSGADMRPRMEALEAARAQGKIRAAGVSNFSVAQMREVQEAGRIDAHQLGYNLIWRYAEDDLIPFCAEHDIAVVTYSTLAHGILTGKFGRDPGPPRRRPAPQHPAVPRRHLAARLRGRREAQGDRRRARPPADAPRDPLEPPASRHHLRRGRRPQQGASRGQRAGAFRRDPGPKSSTA